MRTIASTRGVLFAAAALLWGGASAQVARDGGGNAQLQAMIQELTSQRAQLESETRDLHQKLDAANAEVEKLEKGNDSLQKELARTQSSLTQSATANQRDAQALEQLRGRMNELIAQFRKTVNELRDTEVDRNGLRKALDARNGDLKECVGNNMKLYDVGMEVLDRYEHKGMWRTLRQREPFTQNKRVQLENLVDSYKWKLEDQLLPAAKAEAESTPAPAEGEAGPDRGPVPKGDGSRGPSETADPRPASRY